MLLSLGVRGVFSDCPDLVMKALSRYELELETSKETAPGTGDTVAGGGREGKGGGGGGGGSVDVTIREAFWTWDSLETPKLPDAQVLSDLRRVVFIEEQNVPEKDEWEGGEEECWHWLAVVDGRFVGTVRLKPNGIYVV